MWNAIKRKFRSISSSCCPTLIRPPSGTSPLTPATSCCSSSYYYYDYHSSRSRPIELGYQLSEDEAPAKKRRRGFVRFSGKMKTNKLTEKAVNELNLYGSQGHRVVPDPIDLNAIDPWLSGVRPMDPEMRQEVEYLVQTYDKEYEKLEQSVALPSKQPDDAASIAPSAASNTSKRSAYHLDRVDFATRIRYAKEAAMKENAAKHKKESKIGKEKLNRSKKLNRNLAVSVYSMPLQPPEYRRYNNREGFVALKERFSASSSSRSSSSSSSDSSRKKEKKSKKKKKSKKRKSRKQDGSSKSSGKSHKKTKSKEKSIVGEPENDVKREIKLEAKIEDTNAGETMIEVAGDENELDIEKEDRNIDVEES